MTYLIIPIFLLPILLILFFIKSVKNSTIENLLFLFLFGPSIILVALLIKDNGSEVLIIIPAMLIINALPYALMHHLIVRKRCPRCGHIGVKTLSKDVSEHTTRTIRKYEYSNRPGVYSRTSSRSKIYTTFHMYCPECANLYDVHDEDTRKGEGREKRIQ